MFPDEWWNTLCLRFGLIGGCVVELSRVEAASYLKWVGVERSLVEYVTHNLTQLPFLYKYEVISVVSYPL